MIHFLIAMLIVMSVGSVYTYNVVSTQRSAMYLLEAAREAQRLDQWKSLIESAALVSEDSGAVMLPAGENHTGGNTSYHGLPRWISTDTNNEWGRPIRYCPYSSVTVGESTQPVPLSNLAQYDITTIEVAGQSYVSGSSSAPETGVVGIILSLLPGADSTTCDDVTKVDGKYTVTNRQALVRAITPQSVRDAIIETPITISINEENLLDHEDLIELHLENWSLKQPRRIIVDFGPSAQAYEIPSLSFLSTNPGVQRSITFRGSDQAEVLLDSPAGTYSTFQFEGVNVQFENVTLAHRIGIDLERSTLRTTESTIGQISGRDSQWTISGHTTVNGADEADSLNIAIVSFDASQIIQSADLSINGRLGATAGVTLEQSQWISSDSNIEITAANEITGFVLNSGSEVSFKGVTVSVDENPLGVATVSSLFSIDPTSTLSTRNSTASLEVNAESAIKSSGQSFLYASDIDFLAGADAGVELLGPARLVLDGSRVGNAGSAATMPDIGINSNGGTFVGGENSSIYSNTSCMVGDLFDSALNGSESEGDVNKLFSIFNQSSWTCM